MAAAVTCTPSSPIHEMSFCKVNVTGASSNDTTAHDPAVFPADPQIKYYLVATATGQPTLKSHTFAPSQAGLHEWDNLIFPAAGSWTINLRKSVGDSSVANVVVTVS